MLKDKLCVLKKFKEYGIEPDTEYYLEDFVNVEAEVKELFLAALDAHMKIWVSFTGTKFVLNA